MRSLPLVTIESESVRSLINANDCRRSLRIQVGLSWGGLSEMAASKSWEELLNFMESMLFILRLSMELRVALRFRSAAEKDGSRDTGWMAEGDARPDAPRGLLMEKEWLRVIPGVLWVGITDQDWDRDRISYIGAA